MFGRLVDVVFPPRCAGCGAPGPRWCGGCRERLAELSPPGCRSCGRPLPYDVERCEECPPGPVAWWRAAFLYEGPVRGCLMRLKFGGVRSSADALAPAMVDALSAWGAASRPEPGNDRLVATWVPLAGARRRTRGYDQAEVLARAVASRAGLPLERLLVRTRDTPPQARRGAADRRNALDGAFRLHRRPARRRAGATVAGLPPRVLLVDDVLTTGATTSACARTLLAGGVAEVGVLAAARSLRSGVPARGARAVGPSPRSPDGSRLELWKRRSSLGPIREGE